MASSILSLEDPAHPKQLAEYTETVSGGVHSAYVYTQPKFGTHVYLTDDATGSMRVIDLNDPKNPKEIARWQTDRAPTGRVLHDIDVRDGMAYLSYWNDGLVILDIGNGKWGGSPNAPKLVGQLKYDLDDLYRVVEAEGGPGFIRGTHTAWRHNNYVFVGDEVFSATPQGVTLPGMGLGKANGRLHVIDVSDVTKPREVAWFEPKDGGTHNVWVAGDTLYLGDYQGGLRVLDISGDLRGDLLAQDREIAHVHTGDADGMLPNAAMAWGAFYHNGLVWVNDVFPACGRSDRAARRSRDSIGTGDGRRADHCRSSRVSDTGRQSPVASRRRQPPVATVAASRQRPFRARKPSPATRPRPSAAGPAASRPRRSGRKVDRVDRARIRAHRFTRHERVAPVGREGDAVRDPLARRNALWTPSMSACRTRSRSCLSCSSRTRDARRATAPRCTRPRRSGAAGSARASSRRAPAARSSGCRRDK